MTELLINWIAFDCLAVLGFQPSSSTGDEGMLGPSSNAEAGLNKILFEIEAYPVFKSSSIHTTIKRMENYSRILFERTNYLVN